MPNELPDTPSAVSLVRSFVENAGFVYLLLILGLIVYFDDIQITRIAAEEAPTIYNIRIAGLKIVDVLSISLLFILLWYFILRESITVTQFHKFMFVILLVYCYAGFVGFIYSFFYHYEYTIWLQDFQQTIYMVGFFLFTFHFLTSKKKWKFFVVTLLLLLALKNFFILYKTFHGIGKSFGDWAFRASQNSEFAFFPMMFFPLLILFIKRKSFTLRTVSALILIVYLFNSFAGLYRTVWVMLILGTIYLLFLLERAVRLRLMFIMSVAIGISLVFISLMFPRFLHFFLGFKFASIFDWSVEGDRSNAMRILETTNVTHHVFGNFAFLQGMGLGAWWDDTARRLLPDWGAGFTYKRRFYSTHMWYVTQFLKIGLIGMAFYWFSIYKIFKHSLSYIRSMSWNTWEKCILIGLNVGLLCAFISSADFPRLFLFIGVNVGITSSFIYLDQQERVSSR